MRNVVWLDKYSGHWCPQSTGTSILATLQEAAQHGGCQQHRNQRLFFFLFLYLSHVSTVNTALYITITSSISIVLHVLCIPDITLYIVYCYPPGNRRWEVIIILLILLQPGQVLGVLNNTVYAVEASPVQWDITLSYQDIDEPLEDSHPSGRLEGL